MVGEAGVSLSDNAAKRIAFLLSDEPVGTVFRVIIEGGGCSGFQYRFEFDKAGAQAEDFAIERQGARVAIDPTSLELMKHSVIDYLETLGSAGFEIKNPGATARCGCGNSFGV